MPAWNPFRSHPAASPAAALYAAIVERARDPRFYALGGVPDSLDGRFEMVALHGYLVLRRLRGGGAAAEAMAQALVDALFADMDASLREMGAGDLGVGKRVKRMATGFYGRVAAYDEGQARGDAREALRRNLYGTVSPRRAELEAMARYLGEADASLARQALPEILAGRPDFGEPDLRLAGTAELEKERP
jgi:cytochrome b pre-mRNA-processing protein 3